MRLGFALVLIGACLVGCGSGNPSDDSAMSAAGKLGVPASPSADLLNELSKGNPAVDLSDSKKNERNARMLPQVMANSDNAIRRIGNGEDAGKVVDDLQRQNAEVSKP